MKKKLLFAGEVYEIELTVNNGDARAVSRGMELVLPILARRDELILLRQDGATLKAYIHRDKDRIYVRVAGRHWVFEDVTRRDEHGAAGVGGAVDNVVTPMPGSVIKVLVAPGERVKAGKTLVIVEAMKMENEVKAPADVVIAKVNVKPGQQVSAGQVLVEFEASDGEGGSATN